MWTTDRIENAIRSLAYMYPDKMEICQIHGLQLTRDLELEEYSEEGIAFYAS